MCAHHHTHIQRKAVLMKASCCDVSGCRVANHQYPYFFTLLLCLLSLFFQQLCAFTVLISRFSLTAPRRVVVSLTRLTLAPLFLPTILAGRLVLVLVLLPCFHPDDSIVCQCSRCVSLCLFGTLLCFPKFLSQSQVA